MCMVVLQGSILCHLVKLNNFVISFMSPCEIEQLGDLIDGFLVDLVDHFLKYSF